MVAATCHFQHVPTRDRHPHPTTRDPPFSPQVREKHQLQLRHVTENERHLTHLIGGRPPWVSCEHTQRKYKLMGIDDVPADKAMFFDDDAGRERSVADYFAAKFPKFPLKYPHLPCVCVGKKKDIKGVRLPIELVSLVGGEPLQMTPTLQGEMVKATSDEPCVRFEKILALIRERAPGGRAAGACPAPHFNLLTLPELKTLDARQLPSPRLQYKDHKDNRDVRAMGHAV